MEQEFSLDIPPSFLALMLEMRFGHFLLWMQERPLLNSRLNTRTNRGLPASVSPSFDHHKRTHSKSDFALIASFYAAVGPPPTSPTDVLTPLKSKTLPIAKFVKDNCSK